MNTPNPRSKKLIGDFPWRIQGIPCQILIESYQPYEPMRITGWGFGDADPPEEEELLFQVLDRKGYPAFWLEEKMSDDEYHDLLKHYKQTQGIR